MTRDLISSAYFIVRPTVAPNAIDLEEDKLMLSPESMSVKDVKIKLVLFVLVLFFFFFFKLTLCVKPKMF